MQALFSALNQIRESSVNCSLDQNNGRLIRKIVDLSLLMETKG
jgi:hypothetical protein